MPSAVRAGELLGLGWSLWVMDVEGRVRPHTLLSACLTLPWVCGTSPGCSFWRKAGPGHMPITGPPFPRLCGLLI